MIDRKAIRQRWRLFGSKLDERGRRHFAAVEARTAGRGGIVAVHEITGIARSTIGRGLDELEEPVLPKVRVRREGGGRQAVADVDPTLVADLDRLVEPATMGGRVEMWRGFFRSNISVSAPFVWRCLSGSTVALFPHPAHRTGRADLPHPALGQDLTPSPTARLHPRAVRRTRP